MALTSGGLTNIGLGEGVTANFRVQYEQTLPNQANVIANANALLAVIEKEFTVTTGWFNTPNGKFGPGNRQIVNLNIGGGGGGNNGGYGSAINIDALGAGTSPTETVKMVFMNEWVEILMSLTSGWNAGDSSGEALSQYCGIERFQVGHYSYYNSWVDQWLNGIPNWPIAARSDWVNTTYTGGKTDNKGNPIRGDGDAVSYGCALAFIYYLNVQLDFSVNEIIAAYSTNMATAYRTLTGDPANPFPRFLNLLQSVYPASQTAQIPGPVSDNPFPLWARQFGIAFPGSVRTRSPLVPLLRVPGQEEMFWIGANGDVSSTWRNDNVDNGNWHQQFGIAFPNSVRGDSPLVVFARSPQIEETFWVGANGDVSSTWRADDVDNGNWHQQFGIAFPGSVRAGSPLVPLLRVPGQEEMFWIGANGDVSSTWRNDNVDNGNWHQQFGIAFPNSARADSPLVVFARSPQIEEVFWIGANGDVSSTWRADDIDNGNWHQQFGIAFPSSVRAGSPLVPLLRVPGQDEMFWIGANGDVSSTWRNDNVDNGNWHQQFGIAFPNSVRGDSPLVVFARSPQIEEVFWIGANGDVSSTWRADDVDNGNWHQQFGIAFPGSVRASSPLVPLLRAPGQEEMFWIGANGDVSSTWRNDNIDNGNWHQQFAIAVPGSVRDDSPLVAIARTPQREDVFWIGANGDISNAWRDDNLDGGQWHTQVGIAVPGSVSPGSPLMVFVRTCEFIEVFWLGSNGDVSSTFVG